MSLVLTPRITRKRRVDDRPLTTTQPDPEMSQPELRKPQPYETDPARRPNLSLGNAAPAGAAGDFRRPEDVEAEPDLPDTRPRVVDEYANQVDKLRHLENTPAKDANGRWMSFLLNGLEGASQAARRALQTGSRNPLAEALGGFGGGGVSGAVRPSLDEEREQAREAQHTRGRIAEEAQRADTEADIGYKRARPRLELGRIQQDAAELKSRERENELNRANQRGIARVGATTRQEDRISRERQAELDRQNRQAAIMILILATITVAQHRNRTSTVPLPASGSAGTVTLSLSEYNRLIELASRRPKTPDAVPVSYVLSRAVFKLRVENQTLVGTVDIDGALLEKGSLITPLTTGLTILEAKQAGKPLPLLQDGADHLAILTGPGPFAVSLGVAAPLTIEAGRASFTLPVPFASSSILSLELPGNHANVRVEPGLVTSRTPSNGNTVIEASLEPGKPTRIWWTTREIAAPVAQREVRFLSDVKTVVSVGDSQLRLTALCDLTVIQGEAAEFKLPLPKGYELTTASGSSLESHDVSGDVLMLRVHDPARRHHQFLIALERTNHETKVEAPMIAFSGAQRETGELLVEGIGAIELVATESGGLRRMDVKEASAITRSLSHHPLQAAFRYNRRAADTPKLQLEWKQFQDADVLSAVAERATVTTLTNAEGRSLTEVTLRVRNHAQPFMKVELPAGAQLFSAEVEGERVKPVQGPDGNRVPLLRAGLDSSKAYTVSFVYTSSGSQFTKSGSYDMGLPRLDIPINLLTWEVLLPERLQVKQFGGNAIAAELAPPAVQSALVEEMDGSELMELNTWSKPDLSSLESGLIGGIVVDANGAVIANAQVTVNNTQTGATFNTRADEEGRWVASGVHPGAVKVRISSPGFKDTVYDVDLRSEPVRLATTLEVGQVSEVVTVTADGASINTSQSDFRRIEEEQNKARLAALNAPSQNVFNLQRRVAGILPVRIDVPRSGKSYRFVRPLVLDEETRITFQYKSK